MELAAAREPVDAQKLRELVAEGRAVVLTNAANPPEKICAVGAGLLTKVNANIGTSKDYADLDRELVKAVAAEESGADTLMDLSTGGDIPAIRKRIIASTKLPVGSVPVYEAGAMPRSAGVRPPSASNDAVGLP
jgi:phosphomethylpyrimidine synthase